MDGVTAVHGWAAPADCPTKLMQDVFGWAIRWRGPAMNGGHTIHVGSVNHYIALYSKPREAASAAHFAKGRPLNHIGVEVDDLDATEQAILAKGFETFSHSDYVPGRRFYFFDPDGIEYEVISYV